jgi:hypothetical protein
MAAFYSGVLAQRDERIDPAARLAGNQMVSSAAQVSISEADMNVGASLGLTPNSKFSVAVVTINERAHREPEILCECVDRGLLLETRPQA